MVFLVLILVLPVVVSGARFRPVVVFLVLILLGPVMFRQPGASNLWFFWCSFLCVHFYFLVLDFDNSRVLSLASSVEGLGGSLSPPFSFPDSSD